MGTVRREKRRRLRAVEKVKPTLYKMLDETEFWINDFLDSNGEINKEDTDVLTKIITDFNSQWRTICKKHNIIEVLTAYNDGVSMINNKLKHEREKKRKMGKK